MRSALRAALILIAIVAHLAGFKDTVFVPPGEKVRLLLRAPRHADHHAPYMLHCHLLQHEDRGMMGQFVTALSGS